MTTDIAIVFIILGIAGVMFVTGRVRSDVIGFMLIVLLGAAKILEPKDLLAGFGNQAVITIGAMFVLSASLMRTGVVAALGAKLSELSKGSPLRFLFLSLLTVAFLSAFINNTPVVLVFIPAVLTVCGKLDISPSKLLMPISFASMLGGSCTLIGTSSNILVSSISEESGYGSLGMFEFAFVGLFIVVVGLAYLLLFSLKFLPDRITLASTIPSEDIKEYVTQVRVERESHLIGKKLSETVLGQVGVSVVELIRGDRIRKLDKETELRLGDVLLMRGDLNKILELDRQHEISITPEMATQKGTVKQVEMTLAELMIAPESIMVGRTCRQIGLRKEYDVSLFALQRKGRHHQKDIADLELNMGDILLVRGSMDAVRNLRNSDAFIVLEGVQEQVIEKHKAPIAIATIMTIVVLAATGVMPISILSLAGVVVVLAAHLLTPREVYRAIDWSILVLIAGMLAMGKAMES